MKYVTRTGRALSVGRVTRKSHTVKRGHDGKPLPFHLQCHPMKARPTPVHPDCKTIQQTRLRGMFGMYCQSRMDFVSGVLLDHTRSPIHRAQVWVREGHGDGHVYYHASLHAAWEWAELGRQHGLTIDVIDVTR